MTPGTGLLVLIGLLLTLSALAGHSLLVTLRGGLGPADPPASHPRVDPAGFPTPSVPRGALRRPRPARQAERPRRRSRLTAARAAAAVHTARESRTARRMSPRAGG